MPRCLLRSRRLWRATWGCARRPLGLLLFPPSPFVHRQAGHVSGAPPASPSTGIVLFCASRVAGPSPHALAKQLHEPLTS
eukprot:419682-Alexandrium_andersonii.AAC.1